jgi:hypothetical protein
LHCHADAVKRLLGSGARVDTQDDFGCTPLHWAIYRHFETQVMELALALAETDPLSTSLRPFCTDAIFQKAMEGSGWGTVKAIRTELKKHNITGIKKVIAKNIPSVTKIAKSALVGKKIDTKTILKTVRAVVSEKIQGINVSGILKATLREQKANITKLLEQRRQEAEKSKDIVKDLLEVGKRQGINIMKVIKNKEAVAILTEALEIIALMMNDQELAQWKSIIADVFRKPENAEFRALLEGYGVDVEGLLTWWMALGVKAHS